MNLTADNKRTLRRGWTWLALVLSALVLAVMVCGILGTWVGYWITSNVVIDLSVGVEKTAQAVERGVNRLSTGVGNLDSEVQQIEDRINAASDTIAQQGLLVTVLPDSLVQRVSDRIAQVNETVDAIRDTANATRDLARAVNRIPGVNLPTPDENRVATISGKVEQINSSITEMQDAIAQARQKQAGQVDRLKNVTGRVRTALANVQGDLQALAATLVGIQNAAKQARTTIPTMLFIIALLATLVQVWIIVTQVIVIRRSWHEIKNPPAEPPPAVEAPTAPPPAALPPAAPPPESASPA